MKNFLLLFILQGITIMVSAQVNAAIDNIDGHPNNIQWIIQKDTINYYKNLK